METNDNPSHLEPQREEHQKKSPESRIHGITGFMKSRIFMALSWSLALHGTIALQSRFIDNRPKIEVLKPAFPKTLRTVEKEHLISVLNDDDELIKRLYDQNAEIVDAKTTDRTPRIDPEKVEAHKQQLRRQLAEGEKIRFGNFYENQERYGMGIDPQVIEKGKEYFRKQIEELKKLKNRITDKELLEKMATLIVDNIKDYSSVDDTESSVFEYLASQMDGEQQNNAKLKVNCKTREKKIEMALEELFPGQEKNIFIQYFDNGEGHRIAGFHLNEHESYVFENSGLVLLTEENKAGTLIRKAQDIVQRYAGLTSSAIQIEPGNYTTGKDIPHAHVDDGLDEPLPNGLRLKPATNKPADAYANWAPTIDKIDQQITEIENSESAERAKEGITDMGIIEDSSILPQELEQRLKENERERIKNGDNDMIIRMPGSKPLHSSAIKVLNNWQGRLPLLIYYPQNVLAYHSIDALKEIAGTKAQALGIDVPNNGLPTAFMDHLNPGKLGVKRLEINMKKTGHLPPDQLRKIMSCNTKISIPDSLKGHAVWLSEYDITEEEAAIIAEMTNGGTWLAPGEIIYSDNILRILATAKKSIHIYVETKNQVTKYRRQSPWFFENTYNAYIYPQR
jgi:hypothetical protein